MDAAFNTAGFSPEIPAERLFESLQSAGFASVELALRDAGPFRYDLSAVQFAAVGKMARNLGLQIIGLSGNHYRHAHFAHPDARQRARASDLARHMLEMAHAAEAGSILLIPAFVGGAQDATSTSGYADALNLTADALDNLRFLAAGAGVSIVLENAWNRFLLSPVEALRLLDQVNSPAIGWCVDTGNVLATGYPQDWICTLGARVLRLHVKDYDLTKPGRDGFCSLGAGSVDWPAVRAALIEVRYSGPACYEGHGDPADIRARMKATLQI